MEKTTPPNETNFQIDINKITKDELILINGIGEKTAESIISYREKIGKFTNLNQLLNIEGIGEKTLETLKQYLILDNQQLPPQNPNVEKTTPPNETNFQIDINKITKDELILINGIGEKTAESIISYREKIGKFTNLNQLLNIEGIGEKTLANLKQYLTLDIQQSPSQNSNPNVEKTTPPNETNFPIDINKITKDELILINGIGEKTAESIISYREKIGKFTSLNQLLNIDGIGEETLENLKKYLTLEIPQQTTPLETSLSHVETTSPKTNPPQTETTQITKPVLVNINTASFDELMQVDGMTEEIANKIMEFRELAGPFSQVNEVAMFCSNSVASKIIKQLTI